MPTPPNELIEQLSALGAMLRRALIVADSENRMVIVPTVKENFNFLGTITAPKIPDGLTGYGASRILLAGAMGDSLWNGVAGDVRSGKKVGGTGGSTITGTLVIATNELLAKTYGSTNTSASWVTLVFGTVGAGYTLVDIWGAGYSLVSDGDLDFTVNDVENGGSHITLPFGGNLLNGIHQIISVVPGDVVAVKYHSGGGGTTKAVGGAFQVKI